MKIRSLNNATIHVQTDDYSFLIDPWLIGDLYKGAWSPYAKLKDLSFLSSINCVFISHIHEDHWDLDTLDLVPKNAKILIPKMVVNKVIESKLRERGFKSIEMLNPNQSFSLSQNLILKIINPLNAFAQDLGKYDEAIGDFIESIKLDKSFLSYK
jgi:UDP-MurNAc hydroxylase